MLHRHSTGGTIMAALLAALSISHGNAQGAVATVLHNFTGVPVDGASPVAGLAIGSSGVLFGATSAGGAGIACGAQGCGTVYALTPPSSAGGVWTETLLYNFQGGGVDGAVPAAGLAIDSTGVLYGTTYSGGSASGGTVFSLTPPTTVGAPWTEAVLYSFVPGGNGAAFPAAGVVIGTNGVLYGTTALGGNTDMGTAFSLTPPKVAGNAWTAALLFYFGGPTSGSIPLASLVLDGNKTLFGTTSSGGASGYGTAFGLKQGSNGKWKLTVLHTFGGPTVDGASPLGNLVLNSDGILFGATANGGTYGYGTAFALSPPATSGASWTETVLYNFTGKSDGGQPRAGMILLADGLLFGTTYNGGSASSGAVFLLTPPAVEGDPWIESVPYSFPGGTGGANPQAALASNTSGVLYGVTFNGGSFNLGTVFSLQQ